MKQYLIFMVIILVVSAALLPPAGAEDTREKTFTEAAAATGVIMKKSAVRPIFRADHPFIFMIMDNRSESILFMGRVIDPSKQGK